MPSLPHFERGNEGDSLSPLMGVDGFIRLRTKPWGADGQKDEILTPQAGYALATPGRNEHHIPRRHVLWREVSDLHLACSGKKHISLGDSRKTVPAGGDTGANPGARDRRFRIRLDVRKLIDIAAFGCVELGFWNHASYFLVHAASGIEGGQSRAGGALERPDVLGRVPAGSASPASSCWPFALNPT